MKPDDAPALLPVGLSSAEVVALRDGVVRARPDWLAEEVPVALVFNGLSHAVMLATPADLEDFALGFALTEGLLNERAELYGIEVVAVPLGIELRLEVSSACAWRLRERRRTLAGRTGCGLCGTEQLDQVRRALPGCPVLQVPVAALARAQRALRQQQALQQLTGAVHAAAWCRRDGSVQLLREDVGRHNALDKLIGAMVKQGLNAADGFVCITSRASFEMVQKTAAAGIGVLAAVSAPTRLAVDTARQLGLALAGFVRGDDAVAYTFPERFMLAPPHPLAAMDIDNLIQMANRIGEFFEAMPDQAEARDGITQHLRRYWEPRMRRELVAHVQARDGVGLRPLVLQALREQLQSLA